MQGHWLHGLGMHSLAHTAAMDMLANPTVSAALGAFALLGPGRRLVIDGAVSLYRYAPAFHVEKKRKIELGESKTPCHTSSTALHSRYDCRADAKSRPLHNNAPLQRDTEGRMQ